MNKRIEIKNTVTREKCLNGLISKLDMAKDRISVLEGMSIETPKTEKQREKE